MKNASPALNILTIIRYRATQNSASCPDAGRRICLVVLLLVLTAAAPLPAQVLQQFQNERLQFDLFFKGVNSAASEMHLQVHDSTTKIVWTVRSRALVTLLFKIDNRYEIILDKRGKLLQANKVIKQKNIQQRWTINYDWPTLRARCSAQYDWPILSDIQNLLFMLYDLRTKALSPGDTLSYLLDVESRLYRATGRMLQADDADGNFIGHKIVFNFSPASKNQRRAWKTDLLTNRIARRNSQLTIHLGPPPQRAPLLIGFGGKGGTVEMILKQQ